MASGFDWDGDGAADLAVGAPESDVGGADAGACFVFRGGLALDAISDATILGPGPGTHLGTLAAAAGDVRHNRGGTLLTGGFGLTDSGHALLYGSSELPTSIGAEPVALPGVRLVPAWPNPFNPEVRTRLETDATAAWSVDVLDVRGRRAAQILCGDARTGLRHPLLWNGCDAAGRPVASGVYRIRARSAASTTTIPVTLLRCPTKGRSPFVTRAGPPYAP